MADCLEYTVIPDLPNDECQGKRYNTKCVFSDVAFTLLSIEANSSLDVILNAFVVALNAQKTINDAQQLLIDDLEARILVLEGV